MWKSHVALMAWGGAVGRRTFYFRAGDCQLQLDERERCAADKCEQFHDEQWRRGRARCESLAQAGQCRSNSNHMYKECAEACVAHVHCAPRALPQWRIRRRGVGAAPPARAAPGPAAEA